MGAALVIAFLSLAPQGGPAPVEPAPAESPPPPVLSPQKVDAEHPVYVAPPHRTSMSSEPERTSTPNPPSQPYGWQFLGGTAVSTIEFILVAALAPGSARGNAWYSLAGLTIGAAGTGMVVCYIGHSSSTRQGGCWASIAGALVGMIAMAPGVAIIRTAASPCTDRSSNDDSSCAIGTGIKVLGGYTLTYLGYALGTPGGATIGWSVGATDRGPAPPQTTALRLLTVTF